MLFGYVVSGQTDGLLLWIFTLNAKYGLKLFKLGN